MKLNRDKLMLNPPTRCVMLLNMLAYCSPFWVIPNFFLEQQLESSKKLYEHILSCYLNVKMFHDIYDNVNALKFRSVTGFIELQISL